MADVQEASEFLGWVRQALLEERLDVQRRHTEILQRLQRQLIEKPGARAQISTDHVGISLQVPDQDPRCQPSEKVSFDHTASPGDVPEQLQSQPKGKHKARLSKEQQQLIKGAHPAEQGAATEVADKWRLSIGNQQDQLSVRPREEQGPEPLWHCWLDIAAAAVILLNLITAAVQFQYDSFDLACTVHAELACTPSQEVWPQAERVFGFLEWFFGFCLILELLVRVVFRISLWRDKWWFLLDVSFTSAWVAERVAVTSPFNPTMLRAVRLLRLIRLMRVVKKYTVFDSLVLIFKSIQSCMDVLMWTVVLLLLLMMVVAMLNTTLLQGYIADQSQDRATRAMVFQSWGSFLRAFTSMFEITLANWGPQCWLLMNNVHTGWGFFFILWRCAFGFAVIQVITSVFIQHTFKVAGRDEEVMIKEREKASQFYLQQLDRLFLDLDESGDGTISLEEFESCLLTHSRMKHWFGALEIDVSDVPRIFNMLDDGDGAVTREEFIGGLKKLKGSALSIDLWALTKDVQRLKAIVSTPTEKTVTF